MSPLPRILLASAMSAAVALGISHYLYRKPSGTEVRLQQLQAENQAMLHRVQRLDSALQSRDSLLVREAASAHALTLLLEGKLKMGRKDIDSLKMKIHQHDQELQRFLTPTR